MHWYLAYIQNMVNSCRYTNFSWRTVVNKQLRLVSLKNYAAEDSVNLTVNRKRPPKWLFQIALQCKKTYCSWNIFISICKRSVIFRKTYKKYHFFWRNCKCLLTLDEIRPFLSVKRYRTFSSNFVGKLFDISFLSDLGTIRLWRPHRQGWGRVEIFHVFAGSITSKQ